MLKNQDHEEKNEFSFKNLPISAELKSYANLKLYQLLAQAPSGAQAQGTLEKVPSGYWCFLNIDSDFASFKEQAFASDPQSAVDQVSDRMDQKLQRWQLTPKKPGEKPPRVDSVGVPQGVVLKAMDKRESDIKS